MEAGGKDCEEETLQTAFKKLRVDAESLPGPVSVSDALAPRAASRAALDASGAKPKLCCSKDAWHGSTRKTSRGASRTQRRRRSKSPILHPPKFTYCSTAASSTGCLKHHHLPVPEAVGGTVPAQNELPAPATSSRIAPLVFGSRAAYDTHIGAVVSSTSLQEVPAAVSTTCGRQDEGSLAAVRPSEDTGPEKSACTAAEPWRSGPAESADFRALSQLHSSSSAGGHVPCSCAQRQSSGSQEEGEPGSRAQCRHQAWQGVEVYSFTGLRDVISECELSLPGHEDASRTVGTGGSPRSCSEQARAYVDDVTIEDLSGYMEYYLYIPKKMSHMAEMMYT